MDIISGNFNLKDISVSGQCFRLNEIKDGVFSLVKGDRLLFVSQNGNKTTFHCTKPEYEKIWRNYFDLDTDYEAIINKIPKEDNYLRAAAKYGQGIRILNQDPWETLITFIISQRKNMPAIRSCVEQLSRKFGSPISAMSETFHTFPTPEALASATAEEFYAFSCPESLASATAKKFHTFPTPEALASASLEELKMCSLGYRAEYISDTARKVASGTVDLHALRKLETSELLEALKGFYGVGDKVANCILLFAYHRLDAFPIDVWIRRILDREYGGSFDTSPYKGCAGVIQQYMFFYETSHSH